MGFSATVFYLHDSPGYWLFHYGHWTMLNHLHVKCIVMDKTTYSNSWHQLEQKIHSVWFLFYVYVFFRIFALFILLKALETSLFKILFRGDYSSEKSIRSSFVFVLGRISKLFQRILKYITFVVGSWFLIDLTAKNHKRNLWNWRHHHTKDNRCWLQKNYFIRLLWIWRN